MSKYTILTTLFLVIFFVFPQIVSAASIEPMPIGNLILGESKTTTVSGLEANQNYYWIERKQIEDGYTAIFTDCMDSDGTGKIVQDLGPFRAAGFYRLAIYKTSDREGCFPGNSVGYWDFAVGGPTNQPCCNLGRPIYNPSSDKCEKIALISKDPDKTDCEKMADPNANPPVPRTYCEPDSFRCFSSKTFMVGGKICKESKDESGFDPNKHAVCGFSGGQKTPGCNDPTDPNDPTKPNPNPGIATAIGCIHTNPTELIKDLMKFVIGISGGLAFLMMLLGAFQMLTSAGNPETLSAGRDRLTSAVIGLLFVIFAILLLQIIGVDILKIPGFGR